MLRRIVLAFVFVAALGAAGVGLASKTEAHGGCGYRGGYASYYGYRNVYYGGPSYYAAGYSYVPPVVYHPGRRHHHHRHHHRHHDRGHVSFSLGF